MTKAILIKGNAMSDMIDYYREKIDDFKKVRMTDKRRKYLIEIEGQSVCVSREEARNLLGHGVDFCKEKLAEYEKRFAEL